jgi:hypothetical protein
MAESDDRCSSDDGVAGSGRGRETTTRPRGPDSTEADRPWRTRLRATLARRLGIDARGLAAFRVAVAALVVADLAFRARDLRTFYTDAGVLPRSALAAESPVLAGLSVHALSGSLAVQAALFGATALAAVALLVGYRTRAATILTLGLVASMHARNPYVLNGGDGLLAVSLLLAVFLPVGARWSVDARRRLSTLDRATRGPTAGSVPTVTAAVDNGESAQRDEWTVSIATVTLLVQPVAIYTANAGFKLRSDLWLGGDAVMTVLQLEQFAVRLGPHLTAYPGVLTLLNWLWIVLLAAAPLLLVTTGWRRALLVAPYAAVHLGMLATLRLGLFPLVSVAVLLPFVPPRVWDQLARRLAVPAERAASLADRSVSRARASRTPPRVRRTARRIGTVAVTVVLLASVLWPAMALGLPAAPTDTSETAPDYTWQLFSPHPSTHTRWIVAPATLSTGDRVDTIDGSAVNWAQPRDAAGTYPSTLWHRYVADLRFGNVADPNGLAEYLCRRGVPGRSAAIEHVAFYVVEEPVPSVDGGERQRFEYVDRDCRT